MRIFTRAPVGERDKRRRSLILSKTQLQVNGTRQKNPVKAREHPKEDVCVARSSSVSTARTVEPSTRALCQSLD